MFDLLINLLGGLIGGALYLHLRPIVLRWFRKREDRDAGSTRYQQFKDGK